MRKSSSGAGTLMADETYPRYANLSTAAARHGLFNVGFRRPGPSFPAFSFCLPCWPFVWFQRKLCPGRLCIASSCDWLLVISTDGDRCCKWRGTFSMCLCIFSEVSLGHDGQWSRCTIFGRRWSSILETCPAQRSCALRSMTSMLVALAISGTSMLVTKSLQWGFRMVCRQGHRSGFKSGGGGGRGTNLYIHICMYFYVCI